MEWLSQPWLAVNATATHTTAVLMQVWDGFTYVLQDWVREGDPGTAWQPIWQEALLIAGKNLQPVAPAYHFNGHDLVGLRPASRRVGREVRRGGDLTVGREEFRRLLSATHRGEAKLKVSPAARWALNALAGGYSRQQLKGGGVSMEAAEGPYRTLMEGVESFAAIYAQIDPEAEQARNYAFTEDGRRYISSRA